MRDFHLGLTLHTGVLRRSKESYTAYKLQKRRLLQAHPHHPRPAYCIGRAMQRAVLLRDALTIELATVSEMQRTGAVTFQVQVQE